VYIHALVNNVVAAMAAMRGSQAYEELFGVEEEKGFYFM
jgi:hypothetical protein